MSGKTYGSTWTTVIWDNFDNATTFANNWDQQIRADYNSVTGYPKCQYVSTQSKLTTNDGLSVFQIEAKKGSYDFESAMIRSKTYFDPSTSNTDQYRLTAKIKFGVINNGVSGNFSSSYGAWPACWTTNETVWPTDGEIDMLEAYSKYGSSYSASNLFYGTVAGGSNDLLKNTYAKNFTTTSTVGWHTYEMYWEKYGTDGKILVYKDGVLQATYYNSSGNGLAKIGNYDDHKVIINLAVGGSPFTNSSVDITSTKKAYMWVDYVKVDKRTITP